MVGVDRQVWHPRAKQGVRQPTLREGHAVFGGVAAVEVHVLLRPDDADGGDWLAVHQEVLVGLVPAEEWLRRAVLAAVLVVGADVVPPGLDATGEARQRPQSRL